LGDSRNIELEGIVKLRDGLITRKQEIEWLRGGFSRREEFNFPDLVDNQTFLALSYQGLLQLIKSSLQVFGKDALFSLGKGGTSIVAVKVFCLK